MQLVQPAPRCLASYVDALKRGWSADNVRGAAAVREQLEAIAAGAAPSSTARSIGKPRDPP